MRFAFLWMCLGPEIKAAYVYEVYLESFDNLTASNKLITDYSWKTYYTSSATEITTSTGSPSSGSSTVPGATATDGYIFNYYHNDENFFSYIDTGISLNRYGANEVTTIDFALNNGNASGTAEAPSRLAVEIGGQWYVTAATYEDDDTSGNATWASRSFAWDTAAASWRTLNFTPTTTLSLGAVLGSDLPGGDITGVGIYYDSKNFNGSGRFDEYTLNARYDGDSLYHYTGADGGAWHTATHWDFNGANAVPNNNAAHLVFDTNDANAPDLSTAVATVNLISNRDNTSSATREITGSKTLTLDAASGNAALVNEDTDQTLKLNLALSLSATTEVHAAGEIELAGVVSGTGGLNKKDSGTLRLTGSSSNTFTGTTTVEAGTLVLGKTAGVDALAGAITLQGGTLELAADHQIANTVDLTLSGGTFDTGGYDEVLDNLTLTSDSVIDLGHTQSRLEFTGSLAGLVDGSDNPQYTLSVWNWNANPYGNNSGFDQLVFSGDVLTDNERSQIRFYRDSGVTLWQPPTIQVPSGEVLPVPEPSTWIVGFGLLLGCLWQSRNRLRGKRCDGGTR